MDILICEDNIEQLYELQRIIKEIAQKSVFNIRIYLATTKANEFFQVLQKKCYQPGALFILDIVLGSKQPTGLQLAQMIRKNDAWSSIVFFTTYSEMAYLTFDYQLDALDYILKDEVAGYKRKISDCIQKAYLRQNHTPDAHLEEYQTLPLKIGSKLLRIREADFIYAQTSLNKHRIMIVTVNQQLEIYGSLAKLLLLSDNLCRCHKSYIINKNKVKILDLHNMELVLVDNIKCPVSRKYLKKIKKELGY